MKFRANQTFLDDRTRYEEGEEYDEDEAQALYFVRNGWADLVDDDDVERFPQPQNVRLEIQSSQLGNDTEHAGG